MNTNLHNFYSGNVPRKTSEFTPKGKFTPG